MALVDNGTEISDVYYKGTKIDNLYFKNTLVYVSTIFVAKPSASSATSYTFDNTEHAPTISGYDSAAMTVSGTTAASSSGTYTITYTLKNGYAWSDESTDPVSITWTINKRTISNPSISATSFAWVEGAQHSVTGTYDTTYATMSGTTSTTDTDANRGTNRNVTFALKYPSDTVWAAGGSSNVVKTWTTTWVNGTSHYSIDVFNMGWGTNPFTAYSSAIGMSISNNMIAISKPSSVSGGYMVRTTSTVQTGKTLHLVIGIASNTGTASTTILVNNCKADFGKTNEITYEIGSVGTFATIEYTKPSDDSHPYVALRKSNTGGTITYNIKRIWYT